MSCEVAALLFQAHANYETWTIDFGTTSSIKIKSYFMSLALTNLSKRKVCRFLWHLLINFFYLCFMNEHKNFVTANAEKFWYDNFKIISEKMDNLE